MNLPNKLTLLRIILLPFILLFLLPLPFGEGWNHFVAGNSARFIALFLFCLASLTDLFDGKIARKHNLVTDFGKLFDPIADKLLVLGTFAAFVQLGKVHALVVLLIMAREFLVTGIRQIAAAHGKVIAASMFGKWKTVTQMTALIWLLAEPLLLALTGSAGIAPVHTAGDILLAAAAVMTVLSGYDYFIKNKDLFLKDM